MSSGIAAFASLIFILAFMASVWTIGWAVTVFFDAWSYARKDLDGYRNEYQRRKARK